MDRGYRVLSLFDGIACGMQALKEEGIPVEAYYASEIEPNAIKVATANHPEIEEVGDVTKLDFNKYIGKVDVVMGGSPCQGFSVNGRQLAFLDERSALIRHFFEAVETIRPKYFLLENVVMQKVYEHNIDEVLGVKALRINSALVSPQQRVRLYWTNIPDVGAPEQTYGLNIENTVGLRYSKDTYPEQEFVMNRPYNDLEYADRCLHVGNVGPKDSQATRVYSCKGKHPTLTLSNVARFRMGDGTLRRLTAEGQEVMQGLPIGYTAMAGDGGLSSREPLIGNGWCVPVIRHILSHIPR